MRTLRRSVPFFRTSTDRQREATSAQGRARNPRPFKFSNLTFLIIVANLIGLVFLLFSYLTQTQFRDGLIQAKMEAGRAQAQLIADVLVQTAIPPDECDPRELDGYIDGPAIGVSDFPLDTDNQLCDASLSSQSVNFVFTRMWDSFEGRVRIFDVPDKPESLRNTDAKSLLLEDTMLREEDIVESKLPSVEAVNRALWRNVLDEGLYRIAHFFRFDRFRSDALAITVEDELYRSFRAPPFSSERGASSVRFNENGELVASVTVPIRKVQAVYGFVTAEIGGIDDLVTEARYAVLPFFGMACIMTVITSVALTALIAQPIRQLAEAADKVREGLVGSGRARIPEFAGRNDEIGELARSFKALTKAINARVETIEAFAADVSHELKNPLTSIRSATETLEIATSPEAQQKLMTVIKKDVARMDRLITDISNASRLDAELAREARDAIDLNRFIGEIVTLYETTRKEGIAEIRFLAPEKPCYTLGNPSALGQIFRNIIDNARSFSPSDGLVSVALTPTNENMWRITVDDDGPGIPPDTLDSIFERFYTKRPAGTDFGNNSGLGLAISRQIALAHNGAVWAENRSDKQTGRVCGARFVIELPRA